MATELEVKVRVGSHEQVRARLRELKAVEHGLTRETNTFFDTPGQELRKTDRGLRIRRNRRAGRPDELVVTYKGAKQANPAGLKSREEIELTVSDYDSAVTLLERLGYRVTFSFEKDRETYELGGAEVVLDTLPHLGTFLEVEGDSAEVIAGVLSSLGLAGAPVVAESYIQLITEWAERNAPGRVHVTFETRA